MKDEVKKEMEKYKLDSGAYDYQKIDARCKAILSHYEGLDKLGRQEFFDLLFGSDRSVNSGYRKSRAGNVDNFIRMRRILLKDDSRFSIASFSFLFLCRKFTPPL